jgi:hypothetical protein
MVLGRDATEPGLLTRDDLLELIARVAGKTDDQLNRAGPPVDSDPLAIFRKIAVFGCIDTHGKRWGLLSEN